MEAIIQMYKKTLTILLFLLITILFPIDTFSLNDILQVESFKGMKVGSLPPKWDVKEWKGKIDASIVKDDKDNALRFKSIKTSVALYKEISFNIKDYPFLNWQWKVKVLPLGADVRIKKANDHAAQIYVIFPKFPKMINFSMLGYVWDSNAPVGTEATSSKRSTIKFIVIKSGAKELGTWLSEKRNVYEDYKRLFKEEPPMVGNIALQIDSDDTNSSAESFFGDIYFSKE